MTAIAYVLKLHQFCFVIRGYVIIRPKVSPPLSQVWYPVLMLTIDPVQKSQIASGQQKAWEE